MESVLGRQLGRRKETVSNWLKEVDFNHNDGNLEIDTVKEDNLFKSLDVPSPLPHGTIKNGSTCLLQ